MRKILYDLDVTTNDESINGLPILRVVATVQRYYLDGRDGETMKKAWRIPEPAIQAARQIDRRSLETMKCPEDAIKGQVDAVTSEALQGAVQRDRLDDMEVGSVAWEETYSPKKRLGVLGPATTIPASSIRCPDSVRIKGLRAKYPDLSKRQLEVLAAGLRKQASTCPECGGTGEVTLFTSVRPCSRGCKK